MKIPLNKPYLTGNEITYIEQATSSGSLSGNGLFTKKCQNFFESRYGFKKCLLTTSCTDALEMAAILMDIQSDDEVIIPSYTFVSVANAFVLRGAKIVFADSCKSNPNIDAEQLEQLITPKTKVIVVVHYAGIACDMEEIMNISNKHNLFVVEDAAQAIDAYYENKPLGSFGHFATFSFHETKNVISGEGGLLVVNDEKYFKRAEIIWEKGTNRTAFNRGEIDKYEWVDVGSSFLPSDMISAFLYAQLEQIDNIQKERIAKWNRYYNEFLEMESAGCFMLPKVPEYAIHNAHIFYLLCNSKSERNQLIEYLKKHDIAAAFQYLPLHKSKYYADKYIGKNLINTISFSEKLVRLPLFYDLKDDTQSYIIKTVKAFYKN